MRLSASQAALLSEIGIQPWVAQDLNVFSKQGIEQAASLPAPISQLRENLTLPKASASEPSEEVIPTKALSEVTSFSLQMWTLPKVTLIASGDLSANDRVFLDNIAQVFLGAKLTPNLHASLEWPIPSLQKVALDPKEFFEHWLSAKNASQLVWLFGDFPDQLVGNEWVRCQAASAYQEYPLQKKSLYQALRAFLAHGA